MEDIKIYNNLCGGMLNEQFSGIPEPLASFLIYTESIQNKSANTTEEYFYDLRTFIDTWLYI